MPETKQSKTYVQLSRRLSEIIDWFESAEADVDQAIVKYEQAVEIIAEIEKYLKTAENRLSKIKLESA